MTQTHLPLPLANASFIETNQAFLAGEDAARYRDMFAGFVALGGLHGPGAGLTHTPAPLTAYCGGYYVTETGAITYADNATSWVVADPETTGNSGPWVRVAGTHYLVTVGAPVPYPPLSTVLMEVTTAGGAVTAVRDMRQRSPVQRLAQNGLVYSGYYATLQEAVDALPPEGGTVIVEPGVYTLTSTLTLGNGSAGITSTRTGICLKGLGSGPTGLSILLWAGGADPVIQVKGPISGWAIEDLYIVGDDAATHGVDVVSGQHGVLSGVGIQGCQGAGVRLTTVASSAPEASCRFNRIAGLFINVSGDAGLDVDALSAALAQNNTFENLDIHVTGNGVGIRLGAAVSNTFVGVNVTEPVDPPGSATGSVHLAYDNTVSSQFPAGNTFLNIETQGIAVTQSGAPGNGQAPNFIVGLSQEHTPPPPDVDGLAAIYVDPDGDLHLLASQNPTNGTPPVGSVVIGQMTGKHRDLVPEGDGIASLGSPALRWHRVYTTGSFLSSVATVTVSGTLNDAHSVVLVDATAGAVSITLPPPTGLSGVTYHIKKIDASANAVTIETAGAETIDGAATQTLAAQWDAQAVTTDGTNWFIVGVGP